MNNSPPLIISINEITESFEASFGLNLKIMKSMYGLRSLEVFPNRSSPLFFEHNGFPVPLSLPPDEIIGRSTFISRQWDIGKVKFFAGLINQIGREVCLLDIGANIGLFTRQLAAKTSFIKEAFLYEPHPENFVLLRRNLDGWIVNANFINSGLSDIPGQMEFYEDPDNRGNLSLNKAAMPRHMTTLTVEVMDASKASEDWMALNLPLIYKSDTQGFDEKIASALSLDVFQRVKGACFELWRIPKPDFDHDKFAKVLECFPNKVFDSNPHIPVKVSEIFKFLSGTDRTFKDLLCWR